MRCGTSRIRIRISTSWRNERRARLEGLARVFRLGREREWTRGRARAALPRLVLVFFQMFKSEHAGARWAAFPCAERLGRGGRPYKRRSLVLGRPERYGLRMARAGLPPCWGDWAHGARPRRRAGGAFLCGRSEGRPGTDARNSGTRGFGARGARLRERRGRRGLL